MVAADSASDRRSDQDPTSFRNCARRTVAGLATVGRDGMVASKLKGWLRETGFVDVVERQILAP